MAETMKCLGQSAPTSAAPTDLYTVPGATSAVASSLVVCNQTSGVAKVRVSVAVAGAADESKQYLYYDLVVRPYATFVATLGLTLAATDVVRVLSDVGGVSFNLFGTEIT